MFRPDCIAGPLAVRSQYPMDSQQLQRNRHLENRWIALSCWVRTRRGGLPSTGPIESAAHYTVTIFDNFGGAGWGVCDQRRIVSMTRLRTDGRRLPIRNDASTRPAPGRSSARFDAYRVASASPVRTSSPS